MRLDRLLRKAGLLRTDSFGFRRHDLPMPIPLDEYVGIGIRARTVASFKHTLFGLDSSHNGGVPVYPNIAFDQLVRRVFLFATPNRAQLLSFSLCASITPSANEIVSQNLAHLVGIALVVSVKPVLLKLLQREHIF